MSQNDEKPNFLDRGTLLAVGLILLVWFGWAKFMEVKYPPAQSNGVSASQPIAGDKQSSVPAVGDTPSAGLAKSNQEPADTSPRDVNPSAVVIEKTFSYDDSDMSFELTSKGMGVSRIDVKRYKTRKSEPIVLGLAKETPAFSTFFTDSSLPINFEVEKVTKDTFVGRANINGINIEKKMRVLPGKYAIETEIKTTGNLENFKGIAIGLSEPTLPAAPSSFLIGATAEYQDWFIRFDNKTARQVISPSEALQLNHQNVSVAALSSHYFTLATVDHSDVLPKFESSFAPQATSVGGRLVYAPISRAEAFNVKFTSYAGPKAFEILGSVDSNLPQIIDYGMFGALGTPILWLLKYLFQLMGNWGFAIIVLTIIVRILVLPFNAYSFKSMKAMQVIQPEMNRIKERYKDKPADQKIQMNQEIMQLMKANKASPVGGCLPTLLQLPVFFALYQVLGQSIELYRAPFVFWIHDLSDRDPFFVLPVLMGITMFLQQKLTPTTMDPQQAKILQWMPVIFSFFMLSLPSGLTLYIFVSTLFGICQQYYFMKDNRGSINAQVKEAKA